MSDKFIAVFAVSWIIVLGICVGADGAREYCSLETFNPNCNDGEVILMLNASYGRMKIGRCMKTDFGVENCVKKSLSYFDKQCSGKRQCDVFIPVPELSRKLDCLSELKPYLEASYICQPVMKPKTNDCSGKGPQKVPVSGRGRTLASKTSKDSACGLRESPFMLEAKPGQKIQLSLTDFHWEENSGEHGCKIKYGYILDTESDDVTSICGGSKRNKLLYLSQGHEVQVLLEAGSVQNYNYLIKYQAVGCPDVIAPPHAWIKQQNHSVTIGCHSSAHTWNLRCVGNQWIGYVGNCTRVTTTVSVLDLDIITVAPAENMILPHITSNHLLAFGMICLTIIICCTTIALGCYCTKRYELSYRKAQGRDVYDYNISQASTTLQRMNYKPVTTLIPVHPPTNTLLPPYTAAKSSPALPTRNRAYTGPMGSMYENNNHANGNGQDDGDESVKYYVLENPNELEDNEREQLYQAMLSVNAKV